MDAGDTDGGDLAVEFGTGQLDWEAIDARSPTIELVYGAQGGFHVWGRARIAGAEPDVDISFRATRDRDGRELHTPSPARRRIENGVRYGLYPSADGRLETQAELVILSLDCARNLVGELLTVELFVRERATGRTGSIRRTLRVVDEIPSPTGCVSLPDAAVRDASPD
ncbi:MAG: hypothetical protein JNK05_27255 [Myxococcales bacterium]|nr:hypothetical protein [Myxococcales bacterium]